MVSRVAVCRQSTMGSGDCGRSVTRNRPRLLIIAPARSQGWWGGGKVLAPPLVLPLMAGPTPPDVGVRLIDENVEPADVNAAADWVSQLLEGEPTAPEGAIPLHPNVERESASPTFVKGCENAPRLCRPA